MTRLGVGAAMVGVMLAAGGWVAGWAPVATLGLGMVVLVAASVGYVSRRPRISIERQVEPARVQKGSPAIALVHVANLSRRTLPALVVEQRLGDVAIRLTLPRLRRGEAAVRTYRLPTSRRGEFEVGPVEVVRADPFGLCRTVRRLGRTQTIAVHPRLLVLAPLASGTSRNLEGPSSDTSPQGNITFHRIREYHAGDDLRSVHWASTARTGTLMVRHNVDTAQPYTVVLVDLRPAVYSDETFETAIDVAASLVSSMSVGKAPVQLRTTTGQRLGGPSQRDPRPIVDHLTHVVPEAAGSLAAELLLLRRDRGGTALVVVTGRLDPDSLPTIAALRRRFDRLAVASIVPAAGLRPTFPGVSVLCATTADDLARAWQREASR
ncbi:MAG TPA: DUF58 domain-containing protein [Acidimicrobiales bacterium]|jgi:uncharacterized protein (DUF58 family)|nr:DUF58 domain-containing protein [Acidimicrobiales bacterium]